MLLANVESIYPYRTNDIYVKRSLSEKTECTKTSQARVSDCSHFCVTECNVADATGSSARPSNS